jgi:outer membrane biosynthesis protein TonB
VLAYTAETTFTVSWASASDEHAGVAGYRLYLGHDVEGTSDWFSPENEVEIAPLLPGRYVLRAQAQDRGCSESEWITVQEMVVVDPDDEDTTVPTTAPTSTPTSTRTPEPTQEPTATAEPTREPTATATATAEPTREPTATATATAEPTREPTATATATVTMTATATLESTQEPPSEGGNAGDEGE